MNCFRRKRNETNDNRQYSIPIRKFSLTLFAHSPKSYKYVRGKFSNTLPHPRTMKKWYSESDCHGGVGILPEALKTLQNAAAELTKNGKTLLASLAFDEMAIRRHIQYDHQSKTFLGFCQYGNLNNNENASVANNVLVFMVTVLNYQLSIPVAYYPVTSLTCYEKRDLMVEILTSLHNIGVKIINVTFDGLASNPSTCELLGASFDPKNIVPCFPHPVDDYPVYILLDSCHMLKLLRNALGDLKTMNDPSRGSISWKYFEELESFRVNNKFVTHHITKRHIQYQQNKMNVRLAAQLFSNSSATAMSYLKNSGVKEFKDADSTIYLTGQIDRLFDITNTRKIRGNGSDFKSALNINNIDKVLQFFDQTTQYLRTLKFTRKLCIESRRKRGFIGFLVNMISLRHLYHLYVDSGELSSLATYYLSQDPLESLFSRVRALQGSNDNPTVQQFKSAIRKLLFLSEVASSEFANCEDNLNILTVSSANRKGTEESTEIDLTIFGNDFDGDDYDGDDDFLDEALSNLGQELPGCDSQPQTEQDTTIAFMAGSIEKGLQTKRFACEYCYQLSVFTVNSKIDGLFIENKYTQRPCQSTFLICKQTHDFVKQNVGTPKFNYQEVVQSTLNAIEMRKLFSSSRFSHEDGNYHKLYLVKTIIEEYIRKYATYVAKCLTLDQQKKMLRNRNKRLTIFNGE